MVLEWTDRLSIGNDKMDSDHRNLISMIVTVEHALRSGDAETLSQAFQRLLVGVGIHFSNEERLAKLIGVPFDDHRKTNRSQQNELEHMRLELEAKSGLWSEAAVEHFSHSLKTWVSEHLVRDEGALKPALSAYPYHLKY